MTNTPSSLYRSNKKQVLFFPYLCSDNTYCPAIGLTLDKGKYLFELWGARSGNDCYGTGFARGGYASGILFLHETKNFSLHIGGVGSDGRSTTVKGGNNGGGSGGTYGAAGGGATDVRLDESLQSRIIVAAGAGGGERTSGGHGGGLSGSPGSSKCGTFSLNTASYPGTQYSGGAAGTHSNYPAVEAGSFGKGGSGIPGNADGGGGGGGGYFGGGGTPYVCDGSGGSSYISGHPGCRSVIGPTSTTTSDNTIHYSGMQFLSPLTIAGNNEMPLPSLTYKRGIGNDGSGAIRITILNNYSCRISRKTTSISLFITVLLIAC